MIKKLLAVSVFLFLAAGILPAQIAKGGTAWVSVKSAALKSSTWFFALNRGTLAYGDEVSVLQVSGNWAEVRSSANPSTSGWVNTTNLSGKRIIASGSGGASASEIALAGKGFNQEVENSYKAEGNLNYADVDKTEAVNVSPDELLQFMNEGHLITGEN